MNKFLEGDNYKDRNFPLLLIAMVLCFSSFQTVLTPSIDFIALNIRHDNHQFYNYATIAALVATLPQMSALFAGYVVNNIPYEKTISIIISLIVIAGIIALTYQRNLNLYVIFVITSGILSVALYCSVDRQIVILLSGKIKAFQNDSVILSSILSIINFKFSNWIFTHYLLQGIILYSMLLNIIAYLLLSKIPAIDKILQDSKHSSANLPNPKYLLWVFWQHKPLLVFWGIMLLIMFFSSNFTLLLTTKIHHEGIPISVWSSNMAFMSFGALIGALSCKSGVIRKLNSIKVICIGEIIYATGLILFAIVHSLPGMLVLIYCLGFINPFILINMNSLFFKYLARNNDLVAISPVINGYLLKVNVSYTVLFISTGGIEIFLALVLTSIPLLKIAFVIED